MPALVAAIVGNGIDETRRVISFFLYEVNVIIIASFLSHFVLIFIYLIGTPYFLVM